MSQDIAWLLEEKYSGEKSDAFFADCRRLALGEPLGYLIGHVPFLGCTIHLDSRPLIPRPETEYWVEQAIEAIKGSRSENLFGAAASRSVPPRILDLCAGSGCIGVAVAKAIQSAQVDFSEIDAKHIPTIETNLTSNEIDKSRSNVLQSNLFSAVEDKKYDFILSNPPYVDNALNRVDDSVRDFEPHLALFGGRGGLDIISSIVAAAPTHLTPGGQLWIEHEPEQQGALAEQARQHNFTIATHKDQYSVIRYSILVLQ